MAALRFDLLLLLATVFSSLISSTTQSLDEQHENLNYRAGTDCSSSNPVVCEIHELKLQVARLESVLENATERLNSKSRYAEKCEKRIEEMNHEIDDLQSVLSNLKDLGAEEERVKELQTEVNQLWEASRKNNFELHILQSKAEEAENQLEALASRAEQMANIVTELWIQIQQLEQALQITRIRRAKLQRQILYTRCTFFKIIKRFSGGQYLKVVGFLSQGTSAKAFSSGSSMSKALNWLKGLLSAFKKYHHQLQGIVRQEMQRHKITAPFADAELVFLVASALIIFPIMVSWAILSSQWSS